jgi:hypothetical protein
MNERIDRQPEREAWKLILIVRDEGSKQRADDDHGENDDLPTGTKTYQAKH